MIPVTDTLNFVFFTASHGADGSQVSVVRMGSGGVGNLTEANLTAPLPATGDGTTHVNLTVEGYPPLPLEGQYPVRSRVSVESGGGGRSL